MALPAKPFTAEDALRRDKILLAADARGITRKRLAEAAGLRGNAGEAMVSRWSKGRAHIAPERLDLMEAFLAEQGGEAAGAGAPAPAGIIEQQITELRDLAGEASESDERDELRTLAKRHRRTAVGGVLKLALSAKAESVRLRALEVLLERSDGKPVQEIRDTTPKAPAEADELVSAVLRAVEAAAGQADEKTEAVQVAPTTEVVQ